MYLSISGSRISGTAIPSACNSGGIDGYHCWVEFHAEGKWWPIDILEADKYSSLSTYYFGHHPANRFEFRRGRDLEIDPSPVSGPINFLVYPVLEIDGESATPKTEFSFERKELSTNVEQPETDTESIPDLHPKNLRT